MALRIRRGTNAQRTGKTFELGEIVYTTDSQQLWVGDGVTAGGIPAVGSNVAGYGLAYDNVTNQLTVSGLTADDVEGGINNKYFSNELAVDAVGAALVAGNATNVGITFTYAQTQDDAGRINATVAFDGVGITDVVNDTSPQLGGDLDINDFDITGPGNIDITGDITATGTLTAAAYGDVNAKKIALTDIPGQANASFKLTTNVGGLNGSDFFVINTHHDDAEPITAFFTRSKGSSTSPTALASGDGIFNFGFAGTTTGGAQGVAAGIGVEVGGTVSAGVLPGKLTFYTADTGGAFNLALAIDSSQNATFNGRILVSDGTAGNPSIAFTTDGGIDTGFYHPGDGIICTAINAVEKVRVDTGGMRVEGFMKVGGFATGSLPNPPEAGMIVLDTSTGEFKGYNGAGWVVLG